MICSKSQNTFRIKRFPLHYQRIKHVPINLRAVSHYIYAALFILFHPLATAQERAALMANKNIKWEFYDIIQIVKYLLKLLNREISK